MYISADSSTTRESTTDTESVRTVKVHSQDVKPRCFMEIKIPTNVQLGSITFQLSGNMTGLVLSDNSHGQQWQEQLTVNSLNIEINDSHQNVFLTQPHTINELKISGSYCNCNFGNPEIKSLSFDVKTGALALTQNSALPVNKVILSTSGGTHSIASATLNVDNQNCPTQDQSNISNTKTSLTNAPLCVSSGYVCSDKATS